MTCRTCQYENRLRAKFCEQCATALPRTCSNCDTLLGEAAKCAVHGRGMVTRVGVAVGAIGSLLFTFPAVSQVQTNAFVNPCINIIVLDPNTGENACVTNANGRSVVVGTTSAAGKTGTGSLSVSGGATFSPFSVDVGSLTSGNVAVSGARLNASYFINIGSFAPGILTVSNGGQISASDIDLSANNPVSGTLTINGTGSIAQSTLFTTIGSVGAGAVTVGDGGSLITGGIGLGNEKGSSGRLTIDGTGSQAIATGNSSFIVIGSSGTGLVDVQNGGMLVSSVGIGIGSQSGSQGTLTVGSGGTITAGAGGLIVGDAATGASRQPGGSLSISSGASVTTAGLNIGNQSGGVGAVFVDGAGSSLNSTQNVTVGNNGTGSLSVSNGGTVNFSNSAGISIGHGDGSVGTLTVGSGGTLTAGAGGAAIGVMAGAQGTVSIQGAGSSLTSSGYLNVGDAATGASGQPGGSLLISTGASVTTAGLNIGNQSGGVGAVSVDGAGSSLSSTQNVTVGNNGTGSLYVSNGGTVNLSNSAGISIGHGDGSVGFLTMGSGGTLTAGVGGADIGVMAGAQGTVSIQGAGSSLTSSGYLIVGDAATGASGQAGGSLSISSGASVTTAGLNIGNQSGGVGAVSVDAAGSSLSSTQYITIGNNGTGSLYVTNGGTVNFSTSAGISIGHGDGSVGTLMVGSGGTLTLGTGGADIGVMAGAQGTASIQGAGSSLTSSGYLIVGDAATGASGQPGGSLLISSGASVTTAGLVVGNRFGALGAVSVDGAGSSLSSTQILAVGNAGRGVLNIDSGAAVSITGAKAGANIGNFFAGSSGTVQVSGTNSQLVISGDGSFLNVGNGGQGTLSINRGATVTLNGTGASVGVQGPSGGTGATLTVDGVGSQFTFSGDNGLFHVGIGGSGQGTLLVSNGGMVTIGGANVALDMGNDGTSPCLASGCASGFVTFQNSSTLELTGIGNLVNVYSGAFTTSGSLILNLQSGSTQPLLQNFPNKVIQPNSEATLAGRIAVVPTGAVQPNLGPFFPILNAGTISMGVTAAETVSNSPNGGRTVVQGGVTFTVPSYRDLKSPSGLGILAPERLRYNDNRGGFYEVLGFRAVAVAAAATVTAPPIPIDLNKSTSIASAQTFVETSEVLSAAELSKAVYSTLSSTGTFSITDPHFSESFRVLSSINVGAFNAVAVQDATTPGEISILVRGTLPIWTSAGINNWAANLGFAGPPTDTLRQYVLNLSSFAGSVYAANTGDQIRFVGHSLGGALAELVGAEMGVRAYAFNAPPVGNVFTGFPEETVVITGLYSRTGGPSVDVTQLVNVRLDGDAVSALPLALVGQTISLQADPLAYWLSHAGSASSKSSLLLVVAGQVSGALVSHSINSVVNQLELGIPVSEVQFNDPLNQTSFAVQAQNLSAPSLQDALSRIFAASPSASPGGPQSFQAVVVQGLLYILGLDPQAIYGFSFLSASGSPNFASVALPDLGNEAQQYEIDVLVNGKWTKVAVNGVSSIFTFDAGGVAAFRILSAQALALAGTGTNDVFFGLTFADSGNIAAAITELDQNGNPIPVPEPTTFVLLAAGLLLIAGRRKRWRLN